MKEDHRPLHPSEAALTELEARIAAMARKLVESETSVRMLQTQVEEMSKDQRRATEAQKKKMRKDQQAAEAQIAAMARKLVESETNVRMLQTQVEEMTLLQWSKDQRAIEALRMELGQARKDRAGVEKVAVPGGEVPSTILHDDGEHKVDAVNEDQVGVVLADETQVHLKLSIMIVLVPLSSAH